MQSANKSDIAKKPISSFKNASTATSLAAFKIVGAVAPRAADRVLARLVSSAARLLVRLQSSLPPGFAAELFGKTLLEPLHFIMEERMLRGIRERAERLV